MRWVKRGRIFKNTNHPTWTTGHCQCPNAIVLGDKIRIFFSVRYQDNQSLPVYIDVEKKKPNNVLFFNDSPVLERGRRGTFDENGIIPNFVIAFDNAIYLYYAGWSQSSHVPYKNFTGLAISKDNGNTFVKYSEGPVFGMNICDGLSATGPAIVFAYTKYYSIYSTGVHWFEINGKLEHTYTLTLATSNDAINWTPTGKLLLENKNKFEAICKPAIIKIDDTWHMWFSTRSAYDFRSNGANSYRIGYAYSKDLMNWTRADSKSGIDVSESGWDSEMICYGDILEVDGKHYMFYNGNGFGQSGFGYAELEMD